MPDVLTPNIGLTKPDLGSNNNTWGSLINANFDILDSAYGGAAVAATRAETAAARAEALALLQGFYATVAAGAAAVSGTGTFVSNEGGTFRVYNEAGTAIFTPMSTTPDNIYLPRSTTSALGVIYKAAERFAHDYPGTDGSASTFMGIRAGNLTHTSIASTAFGYEALKDLTSGQLNAAFATRALWRVTTGGVNSAFGVDALGTCTTGGYNDAFGCKALANLTLGNRNKAFGQSCFLRVTIGNDNCGMGQEAGINILTGNNNVVVGNFALYSGVVSTNCTIVGTNSCYNFTGALVTTVGKGTFFSATTAEDNVGLGFEVGYYTTTGGFNVLVGNYCFYNNTVGTHNTALGHRAGYGAAGNEGSVVDTYCTFVGRHASRDSTISTATVLTNMTVLGNDAKGTASNQITLGNAAVTALRAPGLALTISATALTLGAIFSASATDHILSKTVTPAATVGAQTINKPRGSVNFAAAATSLVVTNAAVTVNSIITATVATNDATMKGVRVVAAAGSFTIHADAAPTAETRVNFAVDN